MSSITSVRMVEIACEDRLEMYTVVAEHNVQDRSLLVQHVEGAERKGLQVRDTSATTEGPARLNFDS